MIILSEIRDGDEVIIQDPDGNRARGTVHLSRDHKTLYLQGFGTHLEFARKTAGGWQRSNHIQVMAHQEAMFQ
jgi:hypothetical protein